MARIPLVVVALVMLAVPAQAQMVSEPSYTMRLVHESGEALAVGEVQRLFVEVERQCAASSVHLEAETIDIHVYTSDVRVVVAGPAQMVLPEQTCASQGTVTAAQPYDASLTEEGNATMAVVYARLDAARTTFTSGGHAAASALLPIQVANTTEEPVAVVERSNDSPMPIAAALLPLAALAALRRRR